MAALESLKEFWNALDEIDEKTWVLEPEKPTRSATVRRIAIGTKNEKEHLVLVTETLQSKMVPIIRSLCRNNTSRKALTTQLQILDCLQPTPLVGFTDTVAGSIGMSVSLYIRVNCMRVREAGGGGGG